MPQQEKDWVETSADQKRKTRKQVSLTKTSLPISLVVGADNYAANSAKSERARY